VSFNHVLVDQPQPEIESVVVVVLVVAEIRTMTGIR